MIRMGPAMRRYMHAIAADLLHAGFCTRASDGSWFTMPCASSPAEAHSGWRTLADEYPALAGMLTQTHHDDDVEFDFGLDLLLDGLDRLRGVS
jgi:hypothetical protein